VFLHSYKYYAAAPYDRLGRTSEVYKGDNCDFEDFPSDFARRPPERFRESFEMFKRTIRHHARNSQFVTFSQYREEFQKNGGVWLDLKEVDSLCRFLEHSLDAYSTDSVSVSPAEAFGVVVRVLRVWREKGHLPAHVFVRNLIGPRAPVPHALPDKTVSTGELWGPLTKIDRELDTAMAVPSTVMVGGASAGPGQLLRGLVKVYREIRAERPIDQIVLSGENLPEIAKEPYFRETVYTRKGLYPDDFTGEKICAMCRVQSWTWKPAVKSRAEAGQPPG
jgi:hypothetical protein